MFHKFPPLKNLTDERAIIRTTFDAVAPLKCRITQSKSRGEPSDVSTELTETEISRLHSCPSLCPPADVSLSICLVQIQSVEVVTDGPLPSLTLHHEGFFWRCVFQVEPSAHAVLATLFSM